MPLGKLRPNRQGATRARGVITSELGHSRRFWHIRQRSGYTLISDMVRVAAITEPDIAQALPKPAPKRSPDIIARAVAGN